jgi:predicted dehydrogenase
VIDRQGEQWTAVLRSLVQLSEAGEEGVRIQLQDMVDAIREDRDPVLSGEDARVSLAINMAIYESSRTGREVFLKDLAPGPPGCRAPGGVPAGP